MACARSVGVSSDPGVLVAPSPPSMSETSLPEPAPPAVPRGRTKWFAIGALAVALGGFLFLAVGGIGENLVYYWAPKDVQAAGNRAVGASIRLGGQVATGSVKWEGTSDLEFDVTDGTATVHVVSKGVPPQLFRDRIGVVVEGTMTRGGALREPAPHGLARQPVPRAPKTRTWTSRP